MIDCIFGMTYSVRAATFADLKVTWQRLFPESAASTVFLAPEWQLHWWQHFNDSKELLLLSVTHEGTTAGIAPLMRRDSSLCLLGDKDLFDYTDIVVPRGQEPPAISAILDHLDSLQWNCLDLQPVLADSCVFGQLVPQARQRGWQVVITQEDVSPRLELPSTWDEYLASLDKKQRHELRRKIRRLHEGNNISFYFTEGKEDLDQDMADFFRLFTTSRQDKAQFMTPQRTSFFKAICQDMARKGYLKLFFLEVNGSRVAVCLCFDFQDQLYLYNSGYDLAYSPLSAGLIAKAYCIREGIRLGRKRFDFLRGSEAYKYHLGGRDQPVYRCVISRPA